VFQDSIALRAIQGAKLRHHELEIREENGFAGVRQGIIATVPLAFRDSRWLCLQRWNSDSGEHQQILDRRAREPILDLLGRHDECVWTKNGLFVHIRRGLCGLQTAREPDPLRAHEESQRKPI